MLRVPLDASLPLQLPDAAHVVAFDALHVKADAVPAGTLDGLADSVTLGTTLTVTLDALLVPPDPVQVIENVAAADNAVVD